MQTSQQLNRPKILCRASLRQRLTAGGVFLAAAALFGLLHLAATGRVDMSRRLGLCGFKQRYDLPCPTCSMTASALAFSQGKIFEAFYLQPTAALLCCVLAISAFLAFITAVFGLYFGFLSRFFNEVKIKYIILALIVIVAAGWVVTLARALAAKNQT